MKLSLNTDRARLLDRVAYCMRQTCKATNIVDEPITVRDTFPYNPDSKTAPETARRWASPNYYDKNASYVPEIIVRDNDPFTISITDIHVRSEGGRAYKVIDGDMRRFDLREDQVLEVMKLVGILPRGGVPATFVWGILGSQVRLVLVGGELHKAMIEGADDRKAFDAAQVAGLMPTEASLRVGHVYRKKDKSLHLFLGRVKRPDVDKVMFAFMEMPKAEERDPNDLDKYEDSPHHKGQWLAARKLENELYANWGSLTWRQRCEHEWVTKWKSYGSGTHNPPITFMASPKFEAEVGEVERDLFEEIKKNERNQHRYTDFKSSSYGSIVDDQFKRRYPNGYAAVGDVWEMHHASASIKKLVNDEYRQAHADFRSGLEWQ